MQFITRLSKFSFIRNGLKSAVSTTTIDFAAPVSTDDDFETNIVDSVLLVMREVGLDDLQDYSATPSLRGEKSLWRIFYARPLIFKLGLYGYSGQSS